MGWKWTGSRRKQTESKKEADWEQTTRLNLFEYFQKVFQFYKKKLYRFWFTSKIVSAPILIPIPKPGNRLEVNRK